MDQAAQITTALYCVVQANLTKKSKGDRYPIIYSILTEKREQSTPQVKYAPEKRVLKLPYNVVLVEGKIETFTDGKNESLFQHVVFPDANRAQKWLRPPDSCVNFSWLFGVYVLVQLILSCVPQHITVPFLVIPQVLA